jgi:hypothetical protein
MLTKHVFVPVPEHLLVELQAAEAAVKEQDALEAPLRSVDKAWQGSAEMSARVHRLALAQRAMTQALANPPRVVAAA